MAARQVLARLAAQAARGDLSQVSQVGAAGVLGADWGDSGLLGQQIPRQQHPQQGFFHGWGGWAGANPALSAALSGAQALPGLSDQQQQQHQHQSQQQAGSSGSSRDFLPWLHSNSGAGSSGQTPAWPPHLGGPTDPAHLLGALRAPPHANPQLMPAAGPGINLNDPMLKDSAPSRALLASFLTNAANHLAAQHDHDPHMRVGAAAAAAAHRPGGNRLTPSAGPHMGGGRTRGSNSSIALNKEIMSSSSVEQLLNIVRTHGATFDFFNISTAVSRVPKLIDCTAVAAAHAASASSSASGAATAVSEPTDANRITDLGSSAAGAGPLSGPGHLSPAAKELSDRLCALVLQHLHEFDGRGLANTAWAFAKLRYVPDAALPAQLCHAAVGKIHQFAPQNVSNLAWALVYMHYQDPKLLGLLKEKACDQVYEMKPQELANIMWALASHEQLDVRTARVLGERAAGMANVFKEQELSNIIWAMGRGGHYEAHVLQPLLNAARNKLHSFMPQGVSNMVWALGQLGHRDEALLHAVSRYCPSTLHQYDSQALSNLATGLAALEWEGQGLMQAVASEAASRGSRMAGQHMVAVLAACAGLGIQHDRLVSAVGELVSSRPASLEPPALASLAWACSRMSAVEPHMMEQLGVAIVAKMDRFTGQALVAVSMAFADTGDVGAKVLQAVAARLPAAAHSLTPPQCMAVSWALMQAGAQTPEATASLLQQASSCGAAATQQQSSRALQLCSSLLAAAQAGQRVEPRMHAALLATARACMPDMDAQQLASSCWALAALGVLDVDGLVLYEASMEDLLTQAGSTTNVGAADVKQMCEARAMVATQLAQRVGVPLTALPHHIIPPMPTTLAAAVHASSSLPEPTSLLTSWLGDISSQASHQTAAGNMTSQSLLSGFGASAGGFGAANQLAGGDHMGMWGADVSALAVLAATQDAVAAQQHAAGTQLSSALLNLQLASGNGAAQRSSDGATGSVAPNTWAQSVWNNGGLGNGLLGHDGSSSGSPSAGSAFGGEGSGKRSRRASAGFAMVPGSNAVVDASSPNSRNNAGSPASKVEDFTTTLMTAEAMAAGGGANVMGEWSLGTLGCSDVAPRRDSLDLEQLGSGVWLPKDLLAANHSHASTSAALPADATRWA